MTSKHRNAWLSILAAITMIGAAGCASSGSNSPGDGKSEALTIALEVEPTTLDACDTQVTKNGIVTHGNVVQALTALDPETKAVKPLLALSWTQDNPTTWTFKLRPDVYFQDGTPFDASAAVFGITRTQNEKLSCLNQQLIADTPLTATAVDPTTLRIVSEVPTPILPLQLSYIDLPSPKTPADAKADAVGTGPFEIASWNRGQDITLEGFADYWGDKPEVSGAKYIFRSESSVRANTVKTGEADLAIPAAVQDGTDDDRTQDYSTNAVLFLRAMTDRPPFDDPRVRQALSYAINKDSIVSKLMTGFAETTDQMVVSTNNGFIPDYTGPSYDAAKAKELVSAAEADGVDTSTEVLFITRSSLFPGADEVMQAVVSDLNAAGLNIKINTVDDALWVESFIGPFPASQQVDIMPTLHDNASGDAGFTYPSYITSTGSVSTTSNPKIDELVSQATAARGTERASLFQQAAAELYATDANIIPIAEVFNQLILGEGISYETNGLTGVQLLLSDIRRS